MADRRPLIIPLIILTFIFLSPDPARGPAGSPVNAYSRFQHAIESEQHSLKVLRNSTWTEGLGEALHSNATDLDLAGFEPGRGYAWKRLTTVQDKVRRQLDYVFGVRGDAALNLAVDDGSPVADVNAETAPPLYENVTGRVEGKWVRSTLDESEFPPHLNLSQYAPETPFGPGRAPTRFGRNVTGDDGEVSIRFHEREASDTERFNVTAMEIELALSDSKSQDEILLKMYGVYFPPAGQALLTTTSDKFAGIFALPHLALSEPMFEVSKNLLNGTIERTINGQEERRIPKFNPWSPNMDDTSASPYGRPECELVVYLQQLPPIKTSTRAGTRALSFLERELRFPSGAFLPVAPELRFSMVAFSPDCGFMLESKGHPDYPPQEGEHLSGLKTEVLVKTTRHHALVFVSALALQLTLQVRQMREASTPSTRSRISYYTIGILMLGDGFTWIISLLLSFFVGELAVLMVGVAFLAFINMMFFGMTFFRDVWLVQAPEREAAERQEWEEERRRQEHMQGVLDRIRNERRAREAARTLPAVQTPANADTPPNETGGETQPQPQSAPDINTSVAAPANETAPINNSAANPAPLPPPSNLRPTDTGATPVFMPSDQEGLVETGPQLDPTNQRIPTASFATVYSRFYLLLLGTLLLTLNAIAWPQPIRHGYFILLALVYTTFWLPQIVRNARRNCRRALNWEYVFGQSALRMVPFAYVWGYGGNVIAGAEKDGISLALVGAWVWLQLLVLLSQAVVGPRWFVPGGWVPEAYDYHPVLREDEEGGSLPIGFSQATAAATSPTAERRGSTASVKKSKSSGKRLFDCAICMQDLEVPVIESGGGGDGGGEGHGLGAANGLLARRMYMVTPCRHIFHSACLEGWMKYRLQCPVCREGLPAL